MNEIEVDVQGQLFKGHYKLERAAHSLCLTVWFRGRRAIDDQIAKWAEPSSADPLAKEMLERMVEEWLA